MLLGALMLMSMSACQSGSGIESEFCLLAEPIRPSLQDVLTPGTARQILSHNEKGAALCGWTP